MKALKIACISSLLLVVAACSKVTHDNYQTIETGMTYEEVEKVLGKADLADSSSLAGISTTRAEWNGKDGTISIRFIEEKVRAKNWQPQQP